MTSGWISLARSKPASSDTIGVSVTPPGEQNIDRHSGTVEVFCHDRAERLERGLGGPVGRGAGIQHRAEAGHNVDDPAPALAHHLGHDSVRQRPRCCRVDRDKPAPLIGRDFRTRGDDASCPPE
jgi:hypothetical protein